MGNELDFWFPARRSQRGSRSRQGYVFGRAAMGPPICAVAPYAFADCLLNENQHVMEREDTDLVYRGERKPGQAPVGTITLQDLHDIVMADSDSGGETEVEDSDSDIDQQASSPAPMSPPPSSDVTMSDCESVSESDVAQAGSPAPESIYSSMSEDESDSEPHTEHGSSPAPASIDITMSDSESSASDVQQADAPDSAMEHLGSPFTPRRAYTYAKRDRQRFLSDRALDEAERLVAEQMAADRAAAEAPVTPAAVVVAQPVVPNLVVVAVPAQPVPATAAVAPAQPVVATAAVAPPPVVVHIPRRSARLNPASPTPTHAQLLLEKNVIHTWDNDKPRAVVDKNSYVMAVISGGPKDEAPWWAELIEGALHDIQTALRTVDVSELAVGEVRLRYGISFGEECPMPHGITQMPSNLPLVTCMQNSDFLIPASAYQNHLYQQFAESGHATVATKIDELVGREIVFPAYDHSVFTTSEVELCNGLTPSEKNPHAAFDTMEVLTVFGTWDHTTGGGILFADGDGVVELIPGATIVIASGTKGYSLLPVGLGEKRYIFRQYCHASILRWVDKGGRSDKEFDADAPYEEVLAWNRKRADRGRTSLKMFSRLADVYI